MRSTKDRITLLAQVLSLAASGWFVWIHSVVPKLGRQSLVTVIADALIYVLLAWVLTAFITFYIRCIVGLESVGQVVNTSLRSSAVAMWFAPAVILLLSRTPAGIAAGIVLMVNTTRLLVVRWSPPDRRGRHSRRFAIGLSGALALQTAAVAALWGRPFLACCFFAASLAILTSLYVLGARGEEKVSRVPPSAMSIVLTLLLAAAISTGGMQLGSDGSGDEDAMAGLKNAPKENVTDLYTPPSRLKGDFPGVILRPEVKKRPPLVAPVTVARGSSGSELAKPLIIPFSGEYWIFRAPWSQPPYGSAVRKGSPVDFSFHTSDGKTMEMQAHQKLDPPVDVNSCSSLQVVLTNNGTPGMLSLELTLIEHEQGRSWFQNLGRRFAGLASSQGSETLSFSVPAGGRVRQIDEILVAFHRQGAGTDHSALVAIQQFVLVP